MNLGGYRNFANLKALNVGGQMGQELRERHLEKEIIILPTPTPTSQTLCCRNCCHFVDTAVTVLRLGLPHVLTYFPSLGNHFNTG